ncbi:MAG: hypothetical protein LBL18_04185, partial [Bacteroidales bacterium]|nr:hypothetical protein [Bacteroidales bacterium]
MRKRIHVLSSLVLLAIFFSTHGAFAQIPKLFLQFVEKQNKVQSGYVKLRNIDIRERKELEGYDTSVMEQEIFFISTSKDLKYLTCHRSPYRSVIYSKSAHTLAEFYNLKTYNYTSYSYNDKIHDAKHDIDLQCFYYWIVTVDSAALEFWRTCEFQR